MATWTFIFHLIFPLSGSAEPATTDATDVAVSAAAAAAAGTDVRYRGLEQMFAKFAAEPG